LCPDVALIDIMLGAELGFDLACSLARTVPEPPAVIMIFAYVETEFGRHDRGHPSDRVLVQDQPVGQRHPGPVDERRRRCALTGGHAAARRSRKPTTR
jgi:hypothetical protein